MPDEELIVMTKQLRAEGRHALAAFLRAAELGIGGVFVLRAPSKKRTIPDAAYRSESWAEFVGPAA